MLSQTFNLVDESWRAREGRRTKVKRLIKAGAVVILASNISFTVLEWQLYPPLLIVFPLLWAMSLLGVYFFWLSARRPDLATISLGPTEVVLGRVDGTSRRIPLDSLKADVYLREYVDAPGRPSDRRGIYSRYAVNFGDLLTMREGRPAALTKEAFDALVAWLPRTGFVLKKTSRLKPAGGRLVMVQVYKRTTSPRGSG